jgi:hypothetical protein
MDQFFFRRAVERLRDGLFDPVAVQHLTVEKERIDTVFSKGLKALSSGKPEPLCICGSYGQGKSHTLAWLKQLALSQGYAVSSISLDVREVPFHQFSIVYRALMEKLSFPDGKTFPEAWKERADIDSPKLPGAMPHRFQMVLKAILSKTERPASKKQALKKYQTLHPKHHEEWLIQALMGHDVPLAHLKSVCQYREVEGYREHSLLCRGNASWFDMVQSLGTLLKEIGYKGLLLFFDEAESITQARLNHRAKSYLLLDQFFQPGGSLFPVFAFTEDFFQRVNDEKYDIPEIIQESTTRACQSPGIEIVGGGGSINPIQPPPPTTQSRELSLRPGSGFLNDFRYKNGETFPKNYAQDWKHLNILRLQDFSSRGWESLLDPLIQLYAKAYRIDPPLQAKPDLQSVLRQCQAQETRLKLKSLVHQLDLQTQHYFLER